MARKKSFYAVKELDGKKVNLIFTEWEECKKVVHRHDAIYQGFYTEEDMNKWLGVSKSKEKKPMKEEKTSRRPKQYIVTEKPILGLNTEQQKVKEVLESGKNVFLTGDAGTGKSFVLNDFLRGKENVVVCAPTGISAINVGGSTIHRTFNVPIGFIKSNPKKKDISDVIKQAEIIVIDEISMVRGDVFDYVINYIHLAEKITAKKKQLIVVGDFFQLPPVFKKDEKEAFENVYGEDYAHRKLGFAFLSPLWEKLNFEMLVLNEVVRQDDTDFVKKLNNVRKGIDKEDTLKWLWKNHSKKETDGIFLCPTNKKAQEINDKCISELTGKKVLYQADKEGKISKSDMPTDETLILCAGARVMSVINDTENKYQNGSLGTITSVKDDYVIVDFDNGNTVKIEPHTWEIKGYVCKERENGELFVDTETLASFEQIPLKIAYAITIHKSQGQTYDSVNIFPYCFGDGQFYVALSRARDLNKVHFMCEPQDKWLLTSEDVQKFYGVV